MDVSEKIISVKGRGWMHAVHKLRWAYQILAEWHFKTMASNENGCRWKCAALIELSSWHLQTTVHTALPSPDHLTLARPAFICTAMQNSNAYNYVPFIIKCRSSACHLPSSDNLHRYERRELESGSICHIPVDLICLATELSILKQHHLYGHVGQCQLETLTRGNNHQQTALEPYSKWITECCDAL